MIQPDSSTPLTLATREKAPRLVLEGIFAFPPNRETLGATSYFIVENSANILIDCPAWNQTNQEFLHQQGGVRWLFLTHRGGISKDVDKIQSEFNCEVVIQEQEAYLLPEVPHTAFEQELTLNSNFQAIWTPGVSPGSSCLYYEQQGGVLFTGRHLLPNTEGKPVPLRTAKTFHWWRQLKSIEKLQTRFSASTLSYLCPGANTGFLRGERVIENAYFHLTALNLEALKSAQPGL